MQHVRPSVLFAICAWSLLIMRFGYRFGSGDQVELLPYTLYLHDHSLYPKDFFIHGLDASVPNERTVMAYILLPFVNHLEVFCFIFQAISTIGLVMGLERLAGKFIKNKYLTWLAVLLALIPLNDFALGNVELYSECLQASGIATAIVVWAINLFLERRFLRASALLSAATIIQVLEGLDVMVVLGCIMLVMLLLKQIKRQTFVAFIGIYALTAGVFLVMILWSKTGANLDNCKPLSNAELFKIMFRFRHPHHFIFAAFPKMKAAVFFALTICALVFFSRRSSKLFEFTLFGLMGVIVYAFITDDFHVISIANFQFYKVTQWMKFLGVVAALGLLEDSIKIPQWLVNIKLDTVLLTLAITGAWLVVIEFNGYLPYKVPFQIFGMKQKDDMIDICEKIKAETPKDALFIQPFENTELKFYAQRSSFVEFKANVRHACFVGEWYRRVNLVYGISIVDAVNGFALQDKADAYYYTDNAWTFDNRRGYGITHMLVKKDYKPKRGTLILENNSYAVYKL